MIKKKIIFGITSLTLGGAERVLVDVCNNLCDKYDITIFSIYDNGELKNELKEDVHFMSMYRCRFNELSKLKRRIIPIKIFLFAKAIYNKYINWDFDIEVAFLEGPVSRIFSKKNSKSKSIAWIHNDIKYVFGNNIKSKIKRIIDEKMYNKYSKLVFVSNQNMKSFQEVYPDIDKSKMSVVYNYIDAKLVLSKANECCNIFDRYRNKKFVSVCRLVEQKGIDRLIRIHKKIINEGLVHDFFVIGDGPEKEKLEQLIKLNKVQETFHLLGKAENPYPYIKWADYFCLLSYFEGYGMVLEEAKILNKRIMITDTAACEAVEDYYNVVVLSNDDRGIYEGIKNAIVHKENELNVMPYNNKGKIEKYIEIFEK